MRSWSSEVRQAGLRVGPALLSCIVVLLLLPSSALAQKSTKIGPIDSLLEVRIGAALENARAALSQLGTGGGRDTRDGGRKEAWTLKGTDYATLAFKTDGKGKVVWVSAFARPGKEISFSNLGDLSKAARAADSQAIWNIETPQGGYRLVAKGANGKASVVYLLSLTFPEVQ
ncbi:MAG: hypothetical protein ACR2G5_00355 [Pyrinomonadaceae bacterium]